MIENTYPIPLDVIKFQLSHRLNDIFDSETIIELCSLSPYILDEMIAEEKVHGKTERIYDSGEYIHKPTYNLLEVGIRLLETYKS